MRAYIAKRTRKDAGKPRTYHGKPVLDSKQSLYFVVTNDDCRKSEPNSPTNCAGACAIKRENPNIVEVHMHRSITLIEYRDRVVRYATTHGVRDQLLRFDVAKVFDAGKYHIAKVPKSQIKKRGKQHSRPDRARGAPNSPHARKGAVSLRRTLGRGDFHFTAAN